MFKQMATLFRGKASQAAAQIAERNAMVILDQQIRDAGAAIRQAQRALALAIAEDRQEAARLDAIATRIAGLEDRARAALAAGRDDLALLAAETIAELEMDQAAATQARALFGEEITRLRAMLRDAERRFADLHRGRRLAAVGEAVRRTRNFGGALGISDAETTLEALRGRQALEAAADEAFETEIAAPKLVEARLAEAGFGPATRPTAQAVLARLKPLAITQDE
jgi:phage shock protein A